jgi:hypothetical protein
METFTIEDERMKAIEEFAIHIDYYIRTRSRFDSANPLKYSCAISSIIHDCEQYKNKFIVESTKDFVSNHDRFVLSNDKKNVSVKYLTPFQGSDDTRCNGFFYCTYCWRNWESVSSKKDKWQICSKCGKKIYPYDQHVLKDKDANIKSNNVSFFKNE